MKRVTLAAAAALFTMLPAAVLADSRTITASDFTGIEIASGIKANVSIGTTFSITAESSRPADLDELRTSVSGGVFRAWYDWNLLKLLDFSRRDVTLTIILPALASIDISSGAQVDARGTGSAESLRVDASSGSRTSVSDASAKTYSLDASSGADLVVSGSVCDSAHMDASSGAHVDASSLSCGDVSLDGSSGAHLEAAVRDSIEIDGSSGASLKIYGRPKVRRLDTSSGASIDFAD